VWPPGSADTACPCPSLMTQVQHFVSRVKNRQGWDVQMMWAYSAYSASCISCIFWLSCKFLYFLENVLYFLYSFSLTWQIILVPFCDIVYILHECACFSRSFSFRLALCSRVTWTMKQAFSKTFSCFLPGTKQSKRMINWSPKTKNYMEKKKTYMVFWKQQKH